VVQNEFRMKFGNSTSTLDHVNFNELPEVLYAKDKSHANGKIGYFVIIYII
jgi:hypothetical protein